MGGNRASRIQLHACDRCMCRAAFVAGVHHLHDVAGKYCGTSAMRKNIDQAIASQPGDAWRFRWGGGLHRGHSPALHARNAGTGESAEPVKAVGGESGASFKTKLNTPSNGPPAGGGLSLRANRAADHWRACRGSRISPRAEGVSIAQSTARFAQRKTVRPTHTPYGGRPFHSNLTLRADNLLPQRRILQGAIRKCPTFRTKS